ncbi:ornithine cyclodeaminase family protein [Thermococcus sp. MV5]|uniref:ornithine cyclodeaminase family protein n=1 Tax=Thermococcus sp. MV5 TaxID=1638272 RepID=UPI00143B16A4|nr:ornithine cyclodeaminase family protein [Thermococcus sp. MV5]NJE25161.1 ornithine cyclodeaminase family protein [Thermococcus sp. MV5]
MLLLSRNDLKKVLSMRETIDAVETAFLEFYHEKAEVPLRTIIEIKKHNGFLLYMPSYLKESEALAIKVVSLYAQNPKKGLPSVLATILLNDPETGKPLALMEGSYITAMRTGAASGVATKYLARKDAKIVGTIGAGVQARTQLWAVCEVRDIKEALVYDLNENRAKTFAEEMSNKLGIEILTASSPQDVAKNVDILIVATTATRPVISGEWIQNGTHINSIGWMGKNARELDSETVKRSKLVVDSREGVLSESGDILIPIQEGIIDETHVYAELGEIVAGVKAGRKHEKEITLFKSVGLAIEDAITAKLAYEKALKLGVGTEVTL